jgi:hypothetical protein
MAVNSAKQERCAQNQALFRDVNERLNAAKMSRSIWVTTSEWVCECAEETCTERIQMTPEEYEQLRQDSTHFAVAPDDNHVVPDVERIVEKRERYWVVEKLDEAAEVAEELDARADTIWS